MKNILLLFSITCLGFTSLQAQTTRHYFDNIG